MSKKFAVAHVDFYDNDLIIEIIYAEDWKEALFKHSKLKSDDWDLPPFGDTLEEAKKYSFNCDMMIDVIEL